MRIKTCFTLTIDDADHADALRALGWTVETDDADELRAAAYDDAETFGREVAS